LNVERVIALLKDLEGWRSYVYDDKSPWPRTEVERLDCRLVGGQYKVNATGGTATIGYGETSADFIDRYWGKRITQAEALEKMGERVLGFYRGVQGCITADLTEYQWEAITCRAYQTGAGGFCRSETAKLLNSGRFDDALARWKREFAHPDRSDIEIAHFRTTDSKGAPMKFVSRSEWGAKPGGRQSAVGMTRGVGVHWLGPGAGRTNHSGCAAQMREVQAFHMGPSRGWADFAYNAAVCRHGYVFEGRGPKVRNAANGGGTRNGVDANAGWASILCLAGTDSPAMTDAEKDAINDAAEYLGVAGGEWLGHRDFLSTECPGDERYRWVHAGHPRASGSTTPTPSKEDQLFSPSTVHTVHIIATHSGLMLTSDRAEHMAGVTQQRANGSLNQRWEVWGHTDGTVSLVNRAGGFALDRPDYNTDAGTLLQVARTEHNAAQRWQLDQPKASLFQLWAPGTNRCVDVRGRSMDPGAAAQLWYGLGADQDPRHQLFTFAPTI
jgi:GH24 family phage-related lysozyme (muramidase)